MQRVSVLGLAKCLLTVDELNRYIIGNEILKEAGIHILLIPFSLYIV